MVKVFYQKVRASQSLNFEEEIVNGILLVLVIIYHWKYVKFWTLALFGTCVPCKETNLLFGLFLY